MRRAMAWFPLGLACSMSLVPGCGPDPFAPPPKEAAPVVEDEPTRTVFFVATDPAEDDPEGWKVAGQRVANLSRAIYRNLGPGPGDPPGGLAGLVRKAVSEGASAVVVAVPGESPGLAEALTEAESKGVAAVVLGRPVAAPAGSPPFTTVVPPPFGPTAGEIVEAALTDAKRVGRPAEGTAIILSDRLGDPFAADRVAALKAAAEKAGLKPRVVEFESPVKVAAVAPTARSILESPDTAVVLADGDTAMQLISRVHVELADRLKFAAAGYGQYRNGPLPPSYAEESGSVNYRNDELGRVAVEVALARLGGESRGRRAELDLKFRRGSGKFASDPRPPAQPSRTSGN